METNNIVAAPQIADVDALFEIWTQTHIGSRSVFFEFLSTPSAERDAFLNRFSTEITFDGPIATSISRAI